MNLTCMFILMQTKLVFIEQFAQGFTLKSGQKALVNEWHIVCYDGFENNCWIFTISMISVATSSECINLNNLLYMLQASLTSHLSLTNKSQNVQKHSFFKHAHLIKVDQVLKVIVV